MFVTDKEVIENVELLKVQVRILFKLIALLLPDTSEVSRKVRSDKGKPRPQSKGKAGRPRTKNKRGATNG
jgi:predicted transcriptional regulator with HTH domain